jgi:crotonobetainyl-CoA:carnitine CoA-transferase CaiB-like acyl-CoA transferase
LQQGIAPSGWKNSKDRTYKSERLGGKKMTRPLQGIKVLEIGTHIAIPKTARLLADMGAEVIKIEVPGGEEWRIMGRAWKMPYGTNHNPIFQSEDANKKSLVLNLKDPKGKEVLNKLLSETDIFLTSMRPKALLKLGLDYDSLKDAYPKLIYGSLSGYGELGPDKDAPGFDNAAFWARSGVNIEWSTAEQGPFKPHPGFGDSATCANFISGILLALYNRTQTGLGDYFQSSLYACSLWFNSSGIVMGQPKYGLKYPKTKADQMTPSYPLYKTGDGDWLMIAIGNWNKSAPDMFRRLGLEQYSEDESFIIVENTRSHMAEVIDLLQGQIGKLSTVEARKIFTELDIVNIKLANPAEVTKDEQAWANGYLTEAVLEDGESVVLPTPPYKFRNIELDEFKRAPHLGEHTTEILKGIGYTDAEISTLIQDGVTDVEK